MAKRDWKKLIEHQQTIIDNRKREEEENRRNEFSSFLSDSSDYIKRERETYNAADFDTYESALNTFRSGAKNWKSRSSAARSYLNEFSSSMSEEEYKSYLDYINQFEKELADFDSGYGTKKDYYSQFDSFEDNLDFELRNKYDGANLGMVDRNISAGDISKEEREWLKKNRLHYANEEELRQLTKDQKKKIEDYRSQKIGIFARDKEDTALKDMQNSLAEMEMYLSEVSRENERKKKLQYLIDSAYADPEFEKNSKYVSPIGGEGYNTRFVDQVNDNAPDVYTFAGRQGVIPMIPDSSLVEEYEFRRKKVEEMSPEEKKLYTYFFQAEENGNLPKGTADEYLKAIQLDRRATETKTKELKDAAKEDPVGATLASVILSPMKLPTTAMDIASGVTGQEINPNDYYHQIGKATNAAREGVSEDMSEFGSFLYNTGVSMLDTGYNMLLGGGTGFTTGLMAAGAAGDAIVAAKERGVSDEKAVMTGLIAGAAEALFEKYSIGELKAMASSGGAGPKNFIKNLLKQSFTEASEETLTEISNVFSDFIINKADSEYSNKIQYYVNQGMSYAEAANKASVDVGMQILEAAAGGALSGGVFGLGGATVNAVNNYTVGRDLIKGKQAEETAALAKTFDQDSLTAKRLQEYEKKAEKKGKPSASYAGALYQAMTKEGFENLSAERKSAIESTVKTKLEEKGLNSDDSTVKAVSKAVFGQVYGNEKMTSAEKKIVAEKEYSAAVNELAASPELAVEIESNENYKAAEEKVEKLEEIALETDTKKAFDSKVRSLNVQKTGAELKNLSVDANGDVYAVNGEGTRTPVAEAALTEEAATAVAYSEEMNPAKKKAFFEMYSQVADRIPVDEYHTAFDLAYTYGLKFGGNVEKAVEIAGPVLTEAGALAVFKKGLEQRGAIKAENDAQIQSFRDALGIKTEGGKVDDKAIRYDDLHPSDPRRAVVEFTKVVAQATGRNFVFFRSTAKEQASGIENGRYDPETNTIYIDINAGINETQKILQDQVLPTVSHELVHIFAVEDPAGFASLSELVFEGLTKAEGKTRSFLISQEIQRINEADKNSDEKRLAGKSEETIRAIAEEEIVARACEDRLANSRLMKEFIEEMERKESGLAQKFSNILGEAIKRLKEIFRQIASKLSRSHEATQLRKLTTELEAIQEQYDALLERRNTESTSTSPEQQKNTSDRGVMSAERGTKQSFEEDKYFARQIDKWENIKHGQYVKVGVLHNENPLVLVGLPSGDLRYDVDKIKKNMEKHADYLTKDLLKMIPKVISNPVAISEYLKAKNTISVFFDYYVGNSPIMVGVTISKNRASNEISKIRTFNVRSDVKNLITDENVLYLDEDKKRTRKFFQACGIQVPLGGNIFGFVRSISRDEKNVKSEQLDIINATNPAPNSYSTWIRSVDDIKTLAETLEDTDWEDEVINPDLTRADIQRAITKGMITVYSSYPIENGVFVSPSRMEAESYSGDGKIYQKTVNISDVAWIDPTQGQYAKVGSKVESKGEMKADRATYMTAREILMQFAADEELKNDQAYSPLLREYASRITELDKKYIQLEAAEHDYVASIDAFDSEDKQAKYKYRVDELSREIARIERDLSKQEENKALKKLVLREKAATRKQTEKEARRDTASRMSNYRQSIERKSTLERIEAKTKLLSKKLTENTRKSHIPDDLKQPLDKFLGSINFSIRDLQYGYGTPAEVEFQEATSASEQSTFVKDTKNALKELRKAIEENSQIPIVQAEKQSTDTTEGSQGAAYSGILMIDPHILDEMDSLASYLEKLTDDGITYELAELDLDQAKSLDKILTSVSRAINSIDRAFAGQGKEKISDLGESSMAYMKPIIDESKKKGSSKLAKFLKDATTWDEMTPYTAFSQFGEGGRTIYWNILRGWGDYAFYAKQILDFAEKTWTPEEANEWSETVKTYKLAGQEFEATTAQMMYLYLLSKREQGKLHLNGDGFVIGDYTITKAGVKKTVEAKKVSAIKSTEKERDAFFDHYLPKGSREREVAETMQRFLADTSGAWGNELSYKLYGYRAFTDPNYVPIVADPTKLSASAGDFEGGLYRLMNMGFTKPLNPKANNSVFAVDLFEVFATHAADMAKYRSLALPVMDAIRWMNYSPEFEMEDGSVVRDPNNLQSVMGAAYGSSAFNYVKQFIMDLNGSNGDKVNSMEKLAASLIRAYKTAAVGANLKVVALQPTSYLRALAVLDKSSLIKAFSYMESEDEKGKTDGKKTKKAFNQATQNSGMALWKSLGYYDVGIGRTLTDQIKQYESLYDKALDLSMKLAAKADEATLGVLFKACQIQLIDSGKAAGLSREELLKAAGELLDEVIVRTQVVDSTVTRSQIMRSKSKFTKNLTAFMSEPTVAYNLILQVVFDMQHDLRQGMSFKQALQNNKRTLQKNFAAYTATALASAAVEALFAALRRREDEDEEEILDGILNGMLEISKTFGVKILENANPITMIPMIGDLFEKAWNTLTGKKNYSDNMEYEGIAAVWETVASVLKLFKEGGFTAEKLFSTIDDGTKAASYLTGLPIANAIREVKTLWNNTLGDWTDHTWDLQAPSTFSELEKAFKKGDLRDTVDGLINQKYLELQEERPNVSSSDLRDRAKTSVKSSATAFFKKLYLQAYKKNDRKKMDEIRSAMRQTGLYDHANQTAFEWEEAYREDRREKGLD